MAASPAITVPMFYIEAPLMPGHRSPEAPRFKGKMITKFLREFELLADIASLTDAGKCAYMITYCTEKEAEFVRTLPGFETQNWPMLKSELLCYYSADEDEPGYRMEDLRKFVKEARKIKRVDHLARYRREFHVIAKCLQKRNALTVVDRDDLFYRGFPSKFRRELKYELRAQGLWSDLTRPPHMNDVVAVAQELLQGDIYDVDSSVKSERRPCSRKDGDDDPVNDLADHGSDSASLCQMADSTDLELAAEQHEAQDLESSAPHEEALPLHPSCGIPESRLCGQSEVPAVSLLERAPVGVEVEVRSAALPTELSHVCAEPIVVPTDYESGSGFSTKNLEASDCDQLGSRVEVPELEAKELRPIGLERISDPPVCEVTLAPQTSDWAETAHTCSDKARLPQTMEAMACVDKNELNDLSATTLNSRPFGPLPILDLTQDLEWRQSDMTLEAVFPLSGHTP
ncbi:uncharacterized protein EI90DRAFT_3158169 [Cantharellus anzutake]|uniref:uncharacterized protein n=1 Tax=Cantharellus anzutake TaxID=1750568 RepID=UPI001904978B|nr:uncharacterized protein EI90DRAFT_3158169 [Cantharellus anzutake]KAF8320159.1 hypothetical protein EI90DRAFT_3158169 [Cantharellus anzutake]